MLINNEMDLNAWQTAWANYHVWLAMSQVGLFDLLEDGQARTASDIAQQLNADPRAVEICAHILAHAGLLLFEAGTFRVSAAASDMREPIGELKWQWRRGQNFPNLLNTILSGQPAITTTGGVLKDDETDARQFLQMLHRRSSANVDDAIRVVQQAWANICAEAPQHNTPRILDLGGGHGRYAAAFADALPQAQVTLFDCEQATRIACELSGTGFETLSGDFLRDDVGGPYDIAFLSYVTSGIAGEEVRTLFTRLRKSVVPGGIVVIGDTVIDPSHQTPPFAIDFNLVLLLENENGQFKTVEALGTLLKEAGFAGYQHLRGTAPNYEFIVAR